MPKSGLKQFVEKYPFTTGLIRKTSIDLTSDFIDKRITVAGWQTILASNNFSVCSHLTYKIHSQNNAAIPLLPFCSIEDKWIKEIYLTNDLAQPGVSVDFIIVHPPTKLNYTGIYSQTIDTEGSLTSILNNILGGLGNLAEPYFIPVDVVERINPGGAQYTYQFTASKRVRLLLLCVQLSQVTEIQLSIRDGASEILSYLSSIDTERLSLSLGYPATLGQTYSLFPFPDCWIKPTDANRIEINVIIVAGTITTFNLNALEEP